MRQAITITAFAAVLTACAATPNEVRDEGTLLASTSPRGPDVTARCLQRHWEADNGEITGQVVVPIVGGTYELRVRQLRFGVIALYELTPADGGRTNVRMWYRPVFVSDITQRGLDSQLARCT